MKEVIKRVTLVSLVAINLAYGNEGIVVQPKKDGVVVTQDQRIKNNTQKIEKLFASINKNIATIEKLRVNIKHMIENKDNETLCAVIDSLDRDIKKLTIELTKVQDGNEKTEMNNKLTAHKSIRDEEKAKLDNLNYQCEKY